MPARLNVVMHTFDGTRIVSATTEVVWLMNPLLYHVQKHLIILRQLTPSQHSTMLSYQILQAPTILDGISQAYQVLTTASYVRVLR